MTEDVLYNGKTYKVTDPGKLVYNYDLDLSKDGSGKYQILDQLNNNSRISRWSRRIYLKRKYGLTELDYYIIVVLRGDKNLLPICKYTNPYTGVKCTEPCKFRSLVPTGKNQNIFYDGCPEHTENVAAQIKQRECYKRGVTGLQKADRRSKIWRKKLSDHAKKQMQEGNSIFSPDYVRKNEIPSFEEYSLNLGLPNYGQDYVSCLNKSLDYWKNLGIDNPKTLDTLIVADYFRYLRSGDLKDKCSYYITNLKDNQDVVKFGVLKGTNPSSRTNYHGFKYENTEILYTDSRESIANLEMKVKLKFKDGLILGNEGFKHELKEEILEYIKSIISSTTK